MKLSSYKWPGQAAAFNGDGERIRLAGTVADADGDPALEPAKREFCDRHGELEGDELFGWNDRRKVVVVTPTELSPLHPDVESAIRRDLDGRWPEGLPLDLLNLGGVRPSSALRLRRDRSTTRIERYAERSKSAHLGADSSPRVLDVLSHLKLRGTIVVAGDVAPKLNLSAGVTASVMRKRDTGVPGGALIDAPKEDVATAVKGEWRLVSARREAGNVEAVLAEDGVDELPVAVVRCVDRAGAFVAAAAAVVRDGRSYRASVSQARQLVKAIAEPLRATLDPEAAAAERRAAAERGMLAPGVAAEIRRHLADPTALGVEIDTARLAELPSDACVVLVASGQPGVPEATPSLHKRAAEVRAHLAERHTAVLSTTHARWIRFPGEIVMRQIGDTRVPGGGVRFVTSRELAQTRELPYHNRVESLAQEDATVCASERDGDRIHFTIAVRRGTQSSIVAVGSCELLDGRLIAGDVAVVVQGRTYLARPEDADAIVRAHEDAFLDA